MSLLGLPGWQIDVAFIWTSMFVATNLATAFWHGETLWGHFEGSAHPMRALLNIALLFSLLPLFMIAGFVSSRWEAQDNGFGVFICWIGLLTSLGWLANAVAG